MVGTPPSPQLGERDIPIYSLRDRAHHGFAARALVNGQVAAFHAGRFGLVRGYESRSLTVRAHQSHASRLPVAESALLLSPREAIPLIAADWVHPSFQLPDDYQSLFASISAPLQVVVPLRGFGRSDRARADEPAAEGDGAEPASLAETTDAVAMLWMHDLAWVAFTDLLAMYAAPERYYIFTPLDQPGGQPIFTLEELLQGARRYGRAPFDLVVHDPAFEATGAVSMHTRIRLPAPDEEPALILLRQGSVSADWLAEATGRPVTLAPASDAARRAGSQSDSDLRLRLDRPWQHW
jgi:hypothetical protein